MRGGNATTATAGLTRKDQTKSVGASLRRFAFPHALLAINARHNPDTIGIQPASCFIEQKISDLSFRQRQ